MTEDIISTYDLAWYDVVDELCEKVNKLHKRGFSKQHKKKSVHHVKESLLCRKRTDKLRTQHMHADIESSIIEKKEYIFAASNTTIPKTITLGDHRSNPSPPLEYLITDDHRILSLKIFESLSCLKTKEEKMEKILTYGYDIPLTRAILGKFTPKEYLSLKKIIFTKKTRGRIKRK
eukprot:TRINITY_DN13389_c0_g1_i1.p1 TRINITY_DN13389_c0_g1~~TRINITY_DN13389_c0_g1_i1.p1  ORF type:complete len:176 (-),score=12.12 TRINITY_DN13389_c0_g1_i1:98-625(-)